MSPMSYCQLPLNKKGQLKNSSRKCAKKYTALFGHSFDFVWGAKAELSNISVISLFLTKRKNPALFYKCRLLWTSEPEMTLLMKCESRWRKTVFLSFVASFLPLAVVGSLHVSFLIRSSPLWDYESMIVCSCPPSRAPNTSILVPARSSLCVKYLVLCHKHAINNE